MLSTRSSGILLHPTSLPGQFGSGDFGENAYRFVDWLVSAGQTYWQMLPLGEVGPGNSPYMSSSAFAGNILLIDLEELERKGWLKPEDLIPHPGFQAERMDYALAQPYREERLRRAAKYFFMSAKGVEHLDYLEFCEKEKLWLDDYALFKSIRQAQNFKEWSSWPADLVRRETSALTLARNELANELDFWKFSQWCFYRQWFDLKKYANEKGVQLIGDVPIFVAYDSADVWSNQALFELDTAGRPTLVAGVPPDYFSETGQLWGNPLYRWNVHEDSGYAWWIARLRYALHSFDKVRIDHFRGFANYWAVPANATTAINGVWMPGPGEKLFSAFQNAFGTELPIIAEDLGLITPDVIELRDQFNLPGMRILQFAFGEDESNYFLPHHYVANAVAYTGTHDNDTSVGWWNSAKEHEKSFAQRYLGCDCHEINWQFIKALSVSAANTVLYPLQDVMGLGGQHRMNFPGTAVGNWEWRFDWAALNDGSAEKLAKFATLHSRNPRTI
ncbi:MAG: 4-alpha-glucanotransferase [Sideroxydans sp.]|nr:4-alpha-glucanotransferase [Sideroxydans sp.]